MVRQGAAWRRVVVAGLGDVPVADDAQSGRSVKRSGGNADRLALRGVPEQARSAIGAESAASSGITPRAVDPAQRTVIEDHKIAPRRRRVRRHVPIPAATFLAMADQHVAQWTPHLVAHGAAEAPAARVNLLTGHRSSLRAAVFRLVGAAWLSGRAEPIHRQLIRPRPYCDGCTFRRSGRSLSGRRGC